MNPGLGVVFLVLAVALVWVLATFNRFIRLRQHLRESWADIDVELKRRYDLIPNLVETVKGYARHEKEVLARIVELRTLAVASQGVASAQAVDESKLLMGLKEIFAVAESYPDLKADRTFLDLQRQLALTEDRLAAARRFYNGNARSLNALRETVPTNLVAKMMNIEPASYFELNTEAERVVPRVFAEGGE
ncbi:MAG: LemA family protein [Gemmatimonadetes bacterium]|nr:LemA family protein [Gemmatimonadota bacterium]NNM07388.1 LemA family protein [Gemmatimonadota bacterium]